jgi:hypothetical protein
MESRRELLVLLATLLLMTLSSARAACPQGASDHRGPGGENVCVGRNALMPTSVVPVPADADCPAGSFQWTNARGEAICESLAGVETGHVDPAACPDGSSLAIDAFGNRTCKI